MYVYKYIYIYIYMEVKLNSHLAQVAIWERKKDGKKKAKIE